MNLIVIFVKANQAPKTLNFENKKASKKVIVTFKEALYREFQVPYPKKRFHNPLGESCRFMNKRKVKNRRCGRIREQGRMKTKSIYE